MTGIPAKSSFTGGSVTQGQFKTMLDQLIDALDERLVNGATPIQADTINEASVGAGVTVFPFPALPCHTLLIAPTTMFFA